MGIRSDSMRMKPEPQLVDHAASIRAPGQMKSPARFGFVLMFVLTLIASAFSAFGGNDAGDDTCEFNFNPYHPLTDRLSTFANLGYYENSDYSEYRFGLPGLIYHVEDWLQLWGGLDSYYTDNYDAANELELRPYAGVKCFVPNRANILLYNFTRYEYRDFENCDTHDWSGYGRIRTRFGAEIPLASQANAWQAGTFYALTDAEPFYRFDKDEWDPVRLRGGIGYIFNDRVRAELIYTAQFTRDSPGSSLKYSDNIIQLNIKIAIHKGILDRLFNPGD